MESTNTELNAWLDLYKNSKATYANYKKELNRFYFFLHEIRNSTIDQVNIHLINDYFNFLTDPPLEYVGPKLSRNNENWKPLNKPLSKSSMELSRYVLNVYFTYLTKSKKLDFNPLDLLPRKLTNNASMDVGQIIQAQSPRYFNRKTLKRCLVALYELEKQHIDKPHKSQTYIRYRFILSFLYLTMLRISEFAKITSEHFVYHDSDQSEYRQWVINIVGKGSKHRSIPISFHLKKHIEFYLNTTIDQFTTFGQHTTHTHLIKPIRGTQPISVPGLSYVIKTMFYEIADYVEVQYKDKQNAHLIRCASAHWLRHTGGSHLLANGVDVIKTRDLLGHSSITTTNNYLHTDSISDLNEAISTLSI